MPVLHILLYHILLVYNKRLEGVTLVSDSHAILRGKKKKIDGDVATRRLLGGPHQVA